MRCLRRHEKPCYYALFDHVGQYTDEYGNVTSSADVKYQNPVKLIAHVSPARNTESVEMFGTDINYDKTIVVDDPDTPIDEHAVLWVDTMPVLNEDGTTETPFDYVVRRVARSLNYAVIAIAKVNVRYE